uniref:Protein aurora borealis n=1 Tax=Steinernema glaseri TaxID=37863 RepID=A0A1I7YSL1_9BILA
MEGIKEVPDQTPQAGNTPTSAYLEKLSSNLVSPGLFRKSKSFGGTPNKYTTPKRLIGTPKKNFHWSIEHIAVMCPADIDEANQSQECPFDDARDEDVQGAISKYWDEIHDAVSPDIRNEAVRALLSTPQSLSRLIHSQSESILAHRLTPTVHTTPRRPPNSGLQKSLIKIEEISVVSPSINRIPLDDSPPTTVILPMSDDDASTITTSPSETSRRDSFGSEESFDLDDDRMFLGRSWGVTHNPQLSSPDLSPIRSDED